MAFSAFRGMKPFPQLMFSIFVVVVSFLAFFVLSLIIAVPVFGIDSVLNMPGVNDLNNPQSITILKYFQIVQSLGLFIVPPIILGWLYLGNISEYLFLNKSTTLSSALIVLILMFIATPAINLTGELNAKMQLPDWLSGIERWMKQTEESAAQLTEAFLNVKTTAGLVFNIFMVAFLPAIGEEFLFRGVIQRSFTRMTKSHHWGIWISAIFFSALHMQFYGFLPRLLLGALFGYLLVWSGSMWIPILAHFFNNAFAVISLYMIDNNLMSPEVENFGSAADSIYYAFISLAIIVLLLFLFRKQNKKNTLPSPQKTVH
ncbi:CPBP family intramembrane glutamic endopeptidase [Maribellus maritimus]|uniref:CPBP family intramembrane glutamic endopeptidase n=1 Tax=Maribellus maritimus TaxID=2870838 RepID=UPI001EEC9294|nr:CPBP family intramembrane glutamic endopeptidase [Maribellus maritimus]MCG6187516.1 CPBP family intramembrane metalloprotease [Maribellus maritimus]